MLAKSDPGPQIPTLRVRRHQVLPCPEAAAPAWGRGQVPSRECCSPEQFKQQVGSQSWPVSPANWAADRAWALASGHMLLVFPNCFHLKRRTKIILPNSKILAVKKYRHELERTGLHHSYVKVTLPLPKVIFVRSDFLSYTIEP